MFGKISRVVVVVLALLALVGTVSAQVNNPVNSYLGGDSLFCNSARGCWLLNSNSPAKGSVPVLLGEFPQVDIQAALETCAAEAHNVIIGTIEGTYGPFTLSAVYDGPNANPVCSLQFNGWEGEGKEAKPYVFTPRSDGSYEPIGVPVGETVLLDGGSILPPVPPPVPGVCISSGAKVGDNVEFWNGGTQYQAVITYIDMANQLFDAVGGTNNHPCVTISRILP